MRCLILLLLFLPITFSFSQEEEQTPRVIDSLYREDQFYASFTYNALVNVNEGIRQTGFSTGYHLGFIRDMPLNKRRNFAIGLGFGMSSNSYNQNILITEVEDGYSYQLYDSDADVSKNKFTTYLIDVPLEIRWRTSRPTVNRFWRVYPGFKFSYLVYNSTKTRSDDFGNFNLSKLDDFNELQFAATLSVGYGDWNFHFYYALNPIFDDAAQLEGQTLDISAMKIGIMFYIL